MAVEKMRMLNIIGHLDDLDFISKQLLLLGCIHVVNAQSEIENNNFTISIDSKDPESLVEASFAHPYRKTDDYSSVIPKINTLAKVFGISPDNKRKVNYYNEGLPDIIKVIDEIYQDVEQCMEQLDVLKAEAAKANELKDILIAIENLDIRLEEILNMNYFDFNICRFSKENMKKLEKNYDNVPAIIYNIKSTPGHEIIVSISPKSLSVSVERIFSSLGYTRIALPEGISGTPAQAIEIIEKENQEREGVIKACTNKLELLKRKHANDIIMGLNVLGMHENITAIKEKTVCSDDYFYMAGWIPEGKLDDIKKALAEVLDRTTLNIKDPKEMGSNIKPPTKLKNNTFVKPFEKLVSMYGVPSYSEADPTSFVGISYMLMFGIMFGDVGQGAVFVLAGLLLSALKGRKTLGGILTRLGFSSMIFGFLFGSIFGFEDIIPALLIRPMENIMPLLIYAVVIGSILLTIGYIYNLINAVKRRDLEEGLFGKNGLAGLLFYWMLLFAVLSIYLTGKLLIPTIAYVIILIALLAVIVAKEPLANKILGNSRLYKESKTDYYIEGGFGILELLLSLFSNTVSFIRVGAFALNHVGLFMAFFTMSRMIGNSAGSLLVIIIGNIVIIGLEGLIVFIQGLRLEYYELFGKFFDGSGIPYSPIRLNLRKN